VQVSVAAYPGSTFDASISAINPKVEDATRNVLIRATLPNPDGKLLPGMFTSLSVILGQDSRELVVPESTITYTLYGNSVFVVGPKKGADGKPENNSKGEPQLAVERRFVQTGERRGGFVIISKGLQAGEQVVTGGQLKLDNGASVAISADTAAPVEQHSQGSKPGSAD
jgi:membrane fusion protein (multidrug efflux system)